MFYTLYRRCLFQYMCVFLPLALMAVPSVCKSAKFFVVLPQDNIYTSVKKNKLKTNKQTKDNMF